MPPPWRATACIMIAASVTPSPAPPYSTGMVMPSQPPAAIAWWNSRGKRAVVLAVPPVVVAETAADGGDAFADRLLLGREAEIHEFLPGRPWGAVAGGWYAGLPSARP